MDIPDKITSTVVIASGGLDSTTMLWYLANKGILIKEVISFNYGQRHKKELDKLKDIISEFASQFYQVTQKEVDISSIQDLIAKGSLTGSLEVPKEMYDTSTQRQTIVPNRNMIFLSIAAGRAVTIEASHVVYAAHASDYQVYPDCRPDFISALDKALQLGNLWDPVGLYAPFQNLTKSEIVKIGNALDVPLHLTWSCYEGKERPCLECGTCLERTEAFMSNKIKDPSLSEFEWETAIQKYKEHSQ